MGKCRLLCENVAYSLLHFITVLLGLSGKKRDTVNIKSIKSLKLYIFQIGPIPIAMLPLIS